MAALGHLGPRELLDRRAVRELVEEVREVVGARDVGHALDPVERLGLLLDPGVEVADVRVDVDDDLAVDLDAQPEHAVRGRVLRAHVDPHGFVLDPDVPRLDLRHSSFPSWEISSSSSVFLIATPDDGGPVHVMCQRRPRSRRSRTGTPPAAGRASPGTTFSPIYAGSMRYSTG